MEVALLYEWVIMTNHVHLLAAAKEGYSMSDIMRDLKKFTSGKIHTAIKEHPGESRREWMLRSLMQAGIQNPQNASFQLWQQDHRYYPLLIGIVLYLPLITVRRCHSQLVRTV